MLGLEITLSALGIVGGFRLILFGWGNLADKGLDRFLKGDKGGIAHIVGGFALAYLGAVLGAFSLIYWGLRDRLFS